MTQPFSQKQAEQKFNQPKRLQESPLRQQQGRQESSFQAKAIDLSENGSKTLILFELKSNFWRCLIAWALGLEYPPCVGSWDSHLLFDSQLTAKQISQLDTMRISTEALRLAFATDTACANQQNR
jgi:twitching motility protein PilJ